MTVPDSHMEVLKQLKDTFDGEDVNWAVTGSAGLALLGIDVEPGDIDILAGDKEDIQRIDSILADYSTRELEEKDTGGLKSLFAVYEIDGVEVELMGRTRILVGEDWERLEVGDTRTGTVSGEPVPVLKPEQQRKIYRSMNRDERVRQIDKFRQG